VPAPDMDRRTARVGTAGLALAAGLVVWFLSAELFPYHSLNHDEGVYLQQAAMLLEGKLFLRPPVEDLMRPWFFVESEAGLYPKYAPVPAAMFALGELAGGYRLALVGVGAAIVALTVAVTTEAFDRPAGLLAGTFVLASPLFLLDASVFLPYAPTAMLNLLFAWAYLRADRLAGAPEAPGAADGDDGATAADRPLRERFDRPDRRVLGWATLAGAGVGLAFFARPYTAVLFATPFVAHACWTLARSRGATLARLAPTAALGLAGVGVTLGYNAVVTGDPLLFPYEAFAPLDGLGFGERRILGHEMDYTPELALRANARAVALLFTEWVAGGLVGTALAAAGLATVAQRRPDPRQAALAGVFLTVVAGNVYFWGNANVLGDIDVAGDGLAAVLGPYYHFDLLAPTGAFAGVGALALGRRLRAVLAVRANLRVARVGLAVAVVVATVAVGGVTAGNLDERVEENLEVTRTYEDAYAPFEDGPPRNSVVLLPDPYGNWLAHPLQPLRNDPGYDGRAVYAIDDRPFDVVDAFPDRRAYRYVYRGPWAPYAGSPEAARLQRVREAAGERVRLSTTVGVPGGPESVTVRASTDEGAVDLVATNVSESLSVGLVLDESAVRVTGDLRPVDGRTVGLDGRDVVRLTVFVDYGAAGGFSYRLATPVDPDDGAVRALTPRVERCRAVRTCGGAAAYIPEESPEGVFVRTALSARNGTDKFRPA
jgi:4-amino-4-deoxy-L-arabinose transferase-like glycosyltransferase